MTKIDNIQFNIRVNQDIINGNDIEKYYLKRLQRLRERKPSLKLSESLKTKIKLKLINQLIDEKLLLQYADKNNLFPNKNDISQYQLNHPKKSEKAIHSKLQLKIVLEKLNENVQIHEKDLQQFYDENKRHFSIGEAVEVQHMLIKYPQNDLDLPLVRSNIQKIFKELQQGKDFSELAKKHSECPSNVRGGDLGYITKGITEKAFEDVIFRIPVGTFSDIIETSHGFHLAYIKNSVDNYIQPFESVKSRLIDFLSKIAEKEAHSTLLNQLRDNANIEYLQV